MGVGRTSPTTAPAEPSRLPSMEGAPPTGERVVRRQSSPVRICWAGTAGAAPRIRRPGPWPGHWHRPRRELPRHTPGGSRRCRPTRPWRAPAARHTPGRVELTMSPQLTLCELSSHELSSGGFCQAELASCEPGWILLSRPGRLFWGVRVVLVGLLGRPGAGSCPNLPQRRFGLGSAAEETAEYQRFSSGVSARSGPLWQIWTTGAAAGPCYVSGHG